MTNATPAMQPPTAQPFAAWNPTRGIWETTQLDLYGLSAPSPFSAIWPTCGWMHDGSAYRLPLSTVDIGAPHQRFRIFALARRTVPHPTGDGLITRRGNARQGASETRDDRALAPDHRLRPPRTGWLTKQKSGIGDPVVPDRRTLRRWGRYADAIARWEHITGRPAPAPAFLNDADGPRPAPVFVEWLMGLPTDTNRRLCNQAFFTKVFIDEDNELRVEHNRPFELLLDPQVNANALTWAADANKARTSTNVSVGKGSSLVRAVDLRREFENPCPHLKTLSLRRSRGFYDHDKRSPEPTVSDSRGRAVRSLEMAQTLLRPEQVDDLVAQYREGATLVELASLFGVNRRTVATHLTRREVTIRRGRFDPSRIHEAADLYLSGLTLVEVGMKVGAGPQAVRQALASHGIVIRPGGGRRSRITASAAVGG